MSSHRGQTVRQHEATVNVALARVLRDKFGLSAQAELLVNGRRPDVLVQRSPNPVVIECEFSPAYSVDNDALAKLHLKSNGWTVGVTFAVVLPRQLRDVHESDLPDRLLVSELSWREWHSETETPPRERGSIGDLANAIATSTARSDYLAEAVSCLEAGANSAGSQLHYSDVAMSAIAEVFAREQSREVSNMAALMCINALVFHDRLSASSARVPRVPLRDTSSSLVPGSYVEDLVSSWTRILKIDYRPIFEKPAAVLQALPLTDAIHFVSACRETSVNMIDFMHMVGHDVMGQVFNRLVADRKYLAAYYTSIPAATLLAGLALAPRRWAEVNWSNVDSIREFAVFDPACGTGTLLMASYQQILQNYRASRNGKSAGEMSELHRVLIEDTMHGADVVDAAMHVTASTLATMAPEATFESMNVHVFPLGVDPGEGGKARIGSLEWLETQSVWSMFSGAAQQISSNGSSSKPQVPLPSANLVIANPPFRRHNSSTGEGGYNTRVFGQVEQDAGALSARLSEVLRGTPANLIAGLGSAFMLLADRALCASGRLAFVLPASFLFGTSWREIRKLLSDNYDVEWVVASHGAEDQSLSYDTGIAEAMVVARKLNDEESAPRTAKFVNLWRRPEYGSEASAIHRQIQRAPKAVHAINGPPVGGTELALGSDKWGEIVEAPISDAPWAGSRWRAGIVAQFAWALMQGELYSMGGGEVSGMLPITDLEVVCEISPYHLQIKGSRGVFDIGDGWDQSVRYPAMWHVDSKRQRTMLNSPNARLLPKPQEFTDDIWAHAGNLHVATDVRYNAQRISATMSDISTLGVTSWYTVRVKGANEHRLVGSEAALALWFNSSLGLLCHAHHANRTQLGRGRGNRTMLRALPSLEVRELKDWQLKAAETLFIDLKDESFKPFHCCAIDTTRITLDERFIKEVMGMNNEALDAVSAIRYHLAQEPSICGRKPPMLPRPS